MFFGMNGLAKGMAPIDVYKLNIPTKPLAQVEGPAKRTLSDLALLCATCHRLIYRAIHMRRTWVSVQELAALLSKTSAM